MLDVNQSQYVKGLRAHVSQVSIANVILAKGPLHACLQSRDVLEKQCCMLTCASSSSGKDHCLLIMLLSLDMAGSDVSSCFVYALSLQPPQLRIA